MKETGLAPRFNQRMYFNSEAIYRLLFRGRPYIFVIGVPARRPCRTPDGTHGRIQPPQANSVIGQRSPITWRPCRPTSPLWRGEPVSTPLATSSKWSDSKLKAFTATPTGKTADCLEL